MRRYRTMPNGVNKQIVIGNLGADVELRTTSSGTPVANFRLAATTRAGQDADGQPKEHTEWFSCVLWGKRAEALTPYLTKGKRIYVEGETRTRSWDDEGGQTHYRTEVHVRELVFQPQPGRGGESAPVGPTMPAEEPEDIPF
jgi:single-strand DNA-binding protein